MATVSEPRPSQTSRTRAPCPTPASATMARARLGSARKLWPRALEGRIPWRAARSFRAARPSPELPGEADVHDPLAERGEGREGLIGEVDDPSAEGSTIVDYHVDALAGSEIGHLDHRPEREPGVGGREDGAGREAVPGALARLRAVNHRRSEER